jgi:hypothetical protein
MVDLKPLCFVVMPFTAQHHYVYLVMKDYIEENHSVRCERADDQILTVPLWEKIRGLIEKADVLIGDCTGRNANVFYELGLAHAYNKKVILITSDSIESIPTDLRHFEFIKYECGNHIGFLDKIGNALKNVFDTSYDEAFNDARKRFDVFAVSCAYAHLASKDEFIARFRKLEAIGRTISDPELLNCIVKNNSEMSVMSEIVKFVFPAETVVGEQ